jgi:hypothetical protein
VATPGKHSAAEGGSLSALSNDELGCLWADTVRSFAVRRTGSTQQFWRKLLDEPDLIALHREFKRRAEERAEEWAAYLQLYDT